jgi:thioredoxin 1
LETLDGLRQRKAAAHSDDAPDVAAVGSEEEWVALLAASAKTGIPLFVKFTATWCKPCKLIAPVYHELSAGRGTFVELDVDEVDEVANAVEVNAMPTFHVYAGSRKVAQIEGSAEDQLRQFVADHRG